MVRVLIFLTVYLISVRTAWTYDSACPERFSPLSVQSVRSKPSEPSGFQYDGEFYEFNKPITFKVGDGKNQVQLSVKFQKISEMENSLRNQLRTLKSKSKPGTPQQREMGQIIVNYTDAPPRAVEFTSRDSGGIATEVVETATERSGILQDTMTSFTHIHTHPDIGTNSTIWFTEGDVQNLRDLSSSLNEQLGRKIKFKGILLPICSTCADVALVIEL